MFETLQLTAGHPHEPLPTLPKPPRYAIKSRPPESPPPREDLLKPPEPKQKPDKPVKPVEELKLKTKILSAKPGSFKVLRDADI